MRRAVSGAIAAGLAGLQGMITDGIQSAMAWSGIMAAPRVLRQRAVEAVERIDRDSEGTGEQAVAAAGEELELRTEKLGAGLTMHFLYQSVLENGRQVAKRRPQLVDSRYWCWMLDQAG